VRSAYDASPVMAEVEHDQGHVGKRIKRFRTRRARVAEEHAANQQRRGTNVGNSVEIPPSPSAEPREDLIEMIFLRDLHFGFLPDDCEEEFADCFRKLADDSKFASKVSKKLPLLCRLLNILSVTVFQACFA